VDVNTAHSRGLFPLRRRAIVDGTCPAVVGIFRRGKIDEPIFYRHVGAWVVRQFLRLRADLGKIASQPRAPTPSCSAAPRACGLRWWQVLLRKCSGTVGLAQTSSSPRAPATHAAGDMLVEFRPAHFDWDFLAADVDGQRFRRRAIIRSLFWHCNALVRNATAISVQENLALVFWRARVIAEHVPPVDARAASSVVVTVVVKPAIPAAAAAKGFGFVLFVLDGRLWAKLAAVAGFLALLSELQPVLWMRAAANSRDVRAGNLGTLFSILSGHMFVIGASDRAFGAGVGFAGWVARPARYLAQRRHIVAVHGVVASAKRCNTRARHTGHILGWRESVVQNPSANELFSKLVDKIIMVLARYHYVSGTRGRNCPEGKDEK